jgi:hypothetical protein
VLQSTPRRWLSLAETLPARLLLRPPAAGEWSALDCLHHLVDTEAFVFPRRVEYLLKEQDFPSFDPDTQGTKLNENEDPIELAREFAHLRQESLIVFSRVTPADLAKKGRHAELGIVSLGELINEWAAHDLMHTVQAERALMQPFIAASGPWQPYFADHVAKEASS